MNTEQERADFEAFMGKRYPDVSLKRFATGCYLVSMVRHHWEGWKARAALQSQDDPLQPAANWLFKAIAECKVADIRWALRIGHNRAQRLFDHARRIEENK